MDKQRVISFFGVFAILFISFLLSNNRKKINYRLVMSGMMIQIVFAFIILWTELGKKFFELARHAITQVLSFSNMGAQFLFGNNFKDHYIAFVVLPTIIFVSTMTAVLFYTGILQKVVKIMAKCMVYIMNVSGVEALTCSANVFIGQTEAPLLVKPYLKNMTKSELMAMMTGGMATIAGGVMASYVSMGADAGHLLAASLMAAPGSLVIAKILYPETEESHTKGNVKFDLPISDANVLDAACRGASEGLQLALNVGAMLIAFLSLAHLLNWGLSFLPYLANQPISLERVLSWIFFPLAWLMGVDWVDVSSIATLLGKKIVINEFIAYTDLIAMKEQISPRSFTLATYALCGFANLGSVAIQIGGIGSLVPERRKDFAQIGLKAMIAGSLAVILNACIAGVLLDH